MVSFEMISILAYILANVLDVITTNLVIQNGGHEKNPILRKAMEKLGRLWPLVKFGFALAAGYLAYSAGLFWLIWALTVVFAGVAYNNFKVYTRIKESNK